MVQDLSTAVDHGLRNQHNRFLLDRAGIPGDRAASIKIAADRTVLLDIFTSLQRYGRLVTQCYAMDMVVSFGTDATATEDVQSTH